MVLDAGASRRTMSLKFALLLCVSWIIYSERSLTRSMVASFHSMELPLPKAVTHHLTDPIQNCTQAQLDTILTRHLPPEHCTGNNPWTQKCSITQATKCVEATWLQDHFQQQKGLSNLVGINVGCNKGFDAIDMARMLSNKKEFDRDEWKQAMEQKGTVTNVGCGIQTAQYDIPVDAEQRSSRVFCVEPMPLTVDALNHSSSVLGLSSHGFTVSKAAVSRQGGTLAMFPARVKNKDVAQHEKIEVGTENVGLSNGCKDKDACEEVPVISLDDYVAKHIGHDQTVHVLTIDVEGFDYDVLLGGLKTLARTDYLEFEYNWIGSWGRQKLRECIDLLQSLDFTCYWAGTGKLWRVTGCWLDHYDFHTWSNVACVNRRNADLASRMEDVFLKTLNL